MRRLVMRWVRDEDGMEILEWAIVAVLFAVAASVGFTTLTGALVSGLDRVSQLFR